MCRTAASCAPTRTSPLIPTLVACRNIHLPRMDRQQAARMAGWLWQRQGTQSGNASLARGLCSRISADALLNIANAENTRRYTVSVTTRRRENDMAIRCASGIGTIIARGSRSLPRPNNPPPQLFDYPAQAFDLSSIGRFLR